MIQLTQSVKISIFLLRLALGWLFFYAGITKILNPGWSAAGYLKGSVTFGEFYRFLTQPGIMPVVNFINEWGLLLLGISLILGIGVRLASILGALLMILYYFPVLNFPYIGKNAFLVDEHIIYAAVLAVFAAVKAGRIWGLEDWCAKLPLCSKIPGLRSWFG